MENNLHSIPWARKLKLRHLEVFLVLHETGGITSAAARLHMTQPALSHWLADLESVVGHPLFLRNRRLELTEAGEVLRSHALRMLGDVQRTNAELKAVEAGLQGRLCVGSGLPRVLLPNAIARFQEARPGVFVSVVEAPFATLLDMLANRRIDVIIGALGTQALESEFATEALIADSIQIVAHLGHPCLKTLTPRWSDVLDHPWILPPSGSEMRSIFDASFAARHLCPPMPRVEAGSSIRAQLLMGRSNYLSTLLNSELQLYESFGLRNVYLEPAIRFPDIGAIWDAGRAGAAVLHFLEALRAASRMLGSALEPNTRCAPSDSEANGRSANRS
ncbi:MAG: LysR family transcriptional regulator [Paraburkholderia sp.]|uniref:LysR family transcriptional regulator n=1 Tax=Paraburkholderia sp. TaxID=1926495 RepID=UPI0012032124|nr:LysR family transcriptional regulator [Paraburkholderia sp.]TAL93178.1 MAG: LysR family transcriptional regulator [Paraburkholderia sp.]